MRSLPFRFAAVAAVAAFVAACGAPDMGVTAASAKKIASKVVKNPTVRVIDADTVVTVPADAATVNLEFEVRDEATRQLMDVGSSAAGAAAIAADIATVEFKLTGAALAAPLTAVVPRAKFLDGKAVIQFNNLPPGDITITAVAKDAAGNKVVEANGSGTIKVGELTKVKLACVVPPSTGVGHVRIEMDCFSDDCRPKPAATPTSFVPDPVVDVAFHSLGDPHEDGANGLVFENQKTGTFLAMKTLTNDFSLVKSQAPEPTGKWPGATVNNAVAIAANGDVFKWFLYGRRVYMNGALVPATNGMVIRGKNGTMVTFVSMAADAAICDVVTTQGDKVRIEDHKFYLNLVGSIGKDRVVHEVKGSFGTFNNGTAKQGMLLRDGSQAANLNTFLEDWRATAAENPFATGPAIMQDTQAAAAGNGLIEVK